MRTHPSDYAKLRGSGCVYRNLSPVGWYYAGKWIGYNAREAKLWLKERDMRKEENL